MRGLVLLVAALLLAGCVTPGGPDPGAGRRDADAGPGAKGPAWSFTDTEGLLHERDAPAGNATVLFFMASWCSSCRALAPRLGAVEDDYGGRGVRFYSLSWDTTDDDASLRAWSARYANDWPHGRDPSFTVQKVFGVTSQSSVVVLDRDGFATEKWGYNAMTEPALRAALDAVL